MKAYGACASFLVCIVGTAIYFVVPSESGFQIVAVYLPRPKTILAGLRVVEMPFLFGKSLRHVMTMVRHSSTITLGTFLKGSGTQMQRVLSLTEHIPCSMRGTC